MATIDVYKIKVEEEGTADIKKLGDTAAKTEKQLEDLNAQSKKTAKEGFNALATGADRVAKVVGGALALIAGSAIKMADEIADVAASTGLTESYIYTLSAAVEQAGGKFGDAGKIVVEFYKTLDEAIAGSVTSQEALTKLGITLDDLKTKTQQEIFSKALSELAKIDDSARRTALGIQVFGKAFSTIDPKVLSDLLAKGDFVGIQVEIQRAAEFVGALEQNFRTLQMAALSALEPILGKINNFRLSTEQAEKVIKLMGIALIGATSIAVINGMVKLAEGIKLVATAAKYLAKNPILLAIAAGTLLAGYAAFGDKLKAIIDDLTTINESEAPGTATTTGGKTDEERRGEVYKALQDEQKKLADQQARSNAILVEQNNLAEEYQRTINGTIGLTDEQAKRVKIAADIERDTKRQISEIDRKIAEEREKGAFTNEQLIQQYEAQKKEIQDQANIMKGLRLDEQARLETLQKERDERTRLSNIAQFEKDVAYDILQAEQMRKVIAGEITEEEMNNALALEKIKTESEKRVEALKTQLANAGSEAEKARIQASIDLETQKADHAIAEAKRVQEAKAALEDSAAAGAKKAATDSAKAYSKYNVALNSTNTVIKGLESAIDQFATTGKVKFSDLARSVIADLAKIALKAALNPLFTKIGGSIGGFVGSLFGLAEGGPAKANTPYIVGEKGPELFVPKQAGTVVPNDVMAGGGGGARSGAMGGQPVVNNYNYNNNISAVDAKSVASLFYENRKALFGANQAARKELPYGAAA